MVLTIWLKEWKPGLNWESSGSQHTHCEIHIFQFRSLLKKDNLGCNWRTNAVALNWGKPITLLGLPGSHHLQSYTSYSFTAASHSLFLPLMVEEAVGCQMSLGECQSVSSPSLVPPLLFPAMPRLFATHLPSGKPTFRDNKPENESGHVLTKLNQGKVENFFSSPLTILFLKATKQEVEIIFNVFKRKRDEVIFLNTLGLAIWIWIWIPPFFLAFSATFFGWKRI